MMAVPIGRQEVSEELALKRTSVNCRRKKGTEAK